MVRNRTYERLGYRYGRLFWVVVFSAVLLAGVIIFRKTLFGGSSLVRSLVIAADSMVVLTWSEDGSRLTAVVIPGDTAIEGAFGYGRYSLASLWKLGQIDKLGGELLRVSLEETLGLPIRWYLGKGTIEPLPGESVTAWLREIFSPRGVVALLSGEYRSTVPFPVFFSLARSVSFLKPDQVSVINLRGTSVIGTTTLADGTNVPVLDQERLDLVLGNTFHDPQLRRERVSVAVFNTTGTYALGQRAARILTHLGVLVALVDNDEPIIDRCELRGQEQHLSTITARTIQKLWGCVTRQVSAELRTDLELRVGRDYEDKFKPKR